MKKPKAHERVSINAKYNWGGLVFPEKHDASIGMRLCDNMMREFQFFADRRTVIGDADVANRLNKWLFSEKTMSDIKRNTSFSSGIERNRWSYNYVIGIGNGKKIGILLDVACSGEYCYVCAYADIIPSKSLSVEPSIDMNGIQCWAAVLEDRPVCMPLIYADSATEAMCKLLDFVANKLSAERSLR